MIIELLKKNLKKRKKRKKIINKNH